MIIDKIEQEIKIFIKKNFKHPQFLVLDRVSYAALLDARNISETEDLTNYAGMIVHIEPKDEGKVECI